MLAPRLLRSWMAGSAPSKEAFVWYSMSAPVRRMSSPSPTSANSRSYSFRANLDIEWSAAEICSTRCGRHAHRNRTSQGSACRKYAGFTTTGPCCRNRKPGALDSIDGMLMGTAASTAMTPAFP